MVHHYIKMQKEFVKMFRLNVCFLKLIEISKVIRIKSEKVFVRSSRGN